MHFQSTGPFFPPDNNTSDSSNVSVDDNEDEAACFAGWMLGLGKEGNMDVDDDEGSFFFLLGALVGGFLTSICFHFPLFVNRSAG